MSSELNISTLGVLNLWNDSADDDSPWRPRPQSGEVDPVLSTADDRPSPSQDSLPALADPAADFADVELCKRRRDVEEKHRRVNAYLDESGFDGVFLSRAESLAWFTAGGDLARCLSSEIGAVSLFVGRNCRAVLADNVQSARVFEEELAGLGFVLKERPWHEDSSRMITQLTQNKKVASDDRREGLHYDPARLRALRWPMTLLERQWLRELGRTLTLTVEATCRNFHSGETEADVAGHLAHRLIREGVVPVDLRVAGDDRMARFRQPSFKAAPIERRASISATGRRHGLCASVTRTVSFGKVDPAFRADHSLAAMVDATCIFFSRPGVSVTDVFQRGRRIYEKFEHADEWMLAYQGHQIGYSPREALFHPQSTALLPADSALCWSPSVGAARSEDTIVIDARGFEVVTDAQHWPKLEVIVKGYTIPRPGILER